MNCDTRSLAVEEILDRFGITDPAQRRRVDKEARRRLIERASKAASRALIVEAMGQGWRPPPTGSDVPELPSAFPVPIRQEVYCRVVVWIRRAPGEFSVRDLMRASNFFESASDVRAFLDGLIAQGEVEVVEPLRWPGERGRPRGPKYRAVRRRVASIEASAPKATSDTADVDDLGWNLVLRPDEIRRNGGA